MKILGIDPGSIVMGFGLIETRSGQIFHIENGGIYPNKTDSLSLKLNYIFIKVSELIALHSPDHVAIEDIFVAKNVASALKLGHARAAAMLAASLVKRPVFEYTALQVKKAITSYGHASKEQMQKMIQSLLKLPEIAIKDASDALAVAICHAHSYRILEKGDR